jgi:hypothetical protein
MFLFVIPIDCAGLETSAWFHCALKSKPSSTFRLDEEQSLCLVLRPSAYFRLDEINTRVTFSASEEIKALVVPWSVLLSDDGALDCFNES